MYAVRDEDPIQLEDNFGPGNTYREWLRQNGVKGVRGTAAPAGGEY